jgi:ankyrin repeat protein
MAPSKVMLSRETCFASDLATMLIIAGADILPDHPSQNAVHWIIENLGRLVSNDTYGHASEYTRKLALHKKWRANHLHVLSLILEKTVDIDQVYNGMTPLYMAADWGEKYIVEMLLAKGADDNIKGLQGTPVEVAAKLCYPRVVELLLQKTPHLDSGLLGMVNAYQLPSTSTEDKTVLERTRVLRPCHYSVPTPGNH